MSGKIDSVPIQVADEINFRNSFFEKSEYLREYIDFLESKYRDEWYDDDDATSCLQLSLERLRFVSLAYPIKSKKVATSGLDRLSPILIGPLFTSEKHPWPRKARRFLEPVLQFDLEWVGSLKNIDLGQGILQLWLGPFLSEFTDHEIRIIPKEDFRPELISPIPKVISRRYFRDVSYFAGDDYSWLDKKRGGYSVVMAQMDMPMLTWHESLRDTLEELRGNIDDEDVGPITEFLDFLPARSPSPTPHFFGICQPVQYDAADIPPCLLALDSEGPYVWGDCGNAQIFYIPQDDGTTRFGFAWSSQ